VHSRLKFIPHSVVFRDMHPDFREVPEANFQRLLKAIEECPETAEELCVKSKKEQALRERAKQVSKPVAQKSRIDATPT
jgi:hypothetical protein